MFGFSFLFFHGVLAIMNVSSAQDPPWSCSFGSFGQSSSTGPCNLCPNKKSKPFFWFVTAKNNSYGENQPYFRAALNNPNFSEGVSAECMLLNASLPTSNGGLLSFRYIFNSRSLNERHGYFNYSVCKGEGPVHPLHVVEGWAFRQHSFHCSDVEVSFRAVRGYNFTNVGIDDVDLVQQEVSLQSTSSSGNIQTLSSTAPTTAVLSTTEKTKPQTVQVVEQTGSTSPQEGPILRYILYVAASVAVTFLLLAVIIAIFFHRKCMFVAKIIRSKIALNQSVSDREGQELDPYTSLDATTMEQPAYEGIKATRHGKRGHTNAIKVAKYGNQRIVEQTARVKKSKFGMADENIEHEYELPIEK